MLLIAVAMVPLVAVNALVQFDLRHSREVEVRGQVQQIALRIAAEEQRVIDGVRQLLLTLIELNEIRDRDPKACAELFDRIHPHFQGFQAFSATDRDGVVFCLTTPSQPASVSLGDRGYFQEAMKTGKFAVGDYSIGRFTRKRVISFALAYLDRSGAPGGVVAISVDLDWLAAQLAGPEWNDTQVMSIADRNGVLLVRHPNNHAFVGRSVTDDLWQLAKVMTAPESRDVTSALDGQARILGIVPPSVGPGGLFVAVGVNRDAAFRDLHVASLRSWLAAGVALLASLALAWLFGSRLIRTPISRLIATTRRWRGGDYGARTGMAGSSEISELGRSFDDMAGSLEEAFQHKDMLLRELSHRVMNSLQTIAGLLTLQAKQLADPEARREFSHAVTRINAMALAYRRMQAGDGVEVIDFAAFLRDLCVDLHRSMMPESAPCIVTADPVLLGTDQAMLLALIVNELITNALKHGAFDTPVAVDLSRSDTSCRLAVRSGGTLPPGYDPTTTKGFGMQVVARTARQLGGRLEARNLDGQAEFAVSFVPAAPRPAALGDSMAAPAAHT